MASTQPGSGVQTSTIIFATIGTVATAAVAYAAYFDYKRRSDPNFRRSLKKQQKQLSRASKEEAQAAEKGQKERIRNAVDEANEEGFPKDPEKTEEYFMTEVARGEQMCQDGETWPYIPPMKPSSSSILTIHPQQAPTPLTPPFASTRP